MKYSHIIWDWNGTIINDARLCVDLVNEILDELYDRDNNIEEVLNIYECINDLKDVVKNKPETNIELGEITTSLMEVVKTTKKGTSTTYNRFKIRK
mgnify:CR=1 FL=1